MSDFYMFGLQVLNKILIDENCTCIIIANGYFVLVTPNLLIYVYLPSPIEVSLHQLTRNEGSFKPALRTIPNRTLQARQTITAFIASSNHRKSQARSRISRLFASITTSTGIYHDNLFFFRPRAFSLSSLPCAFKFHSVIFLTLLFLFDFSN